MKEIAFRKQNVGKWKEAETLLQKGSKSQPDDLIRCYQELSDDLAYVRAKYPGGNIEHYLNDLLSKFHQGIYKNKREKPGRIKEFWAKELPFLWHENRRYLLYSFLFFAVAMIIGIFSSMKDPTFARSILGDAYVNMTLGNIQKDDPMAVYKKMKESEMFLMITVNNVRVSFLAFAGGVLAGFGTLFILLQNGIMLGTFQYFFHEFDLLWETILVIWIHGTIEISAIIIAGGAGLTMASGMLFPGSLPRIDALKSKSKQAMKMVVGLVPFFVLAGFLESYVTRHTHMPVWLSLSIILGSLFLVLWYFVWYPYMLFGKPKNEM